MFSKTESNSFEGAFPADNTVRKVKHFALKKDLDNCKLHIKINNFYLKHFSVKPRPDHDLMYDLKEKKEILI